MSSSQVISEVPNLVLFKWVSYVKKIYKVLFIIIFQLLLLVSFGGSPEDTNYNAIPCYSLKYMSHI